VVALRCWCAADAELAGFPPQTVRLLADSSSTGGRLSTQQVTLLGGADGVNPHHHASSAELFYVLSGSVQLLAGERLLVAGEGDLAVVPPGLPHAFAAARGSDADLLIVITPASKDSSISAAWPGSPPASIRPRACSRFRPSTTPSSTTARPGSKHVAAIGRIPKGALSRRLP
jgi:mannose-6-phosphate isomerase-like protein (cupin superfamily)